MKHPGAAALFALLVVAALALWAADEDAPSSPTDLGSTSERVGPSLVHALDDLAANPLAEKCFTCHGTEPSAREWAESGHASNLAALRRSPLAQDECLPCHSAPAAPTAAKAWNPDGAGLQATISTAVNEVSCSSCHSHLSKRDALLAMPVSQLCISCHTMDCGCSGEGVIHQSQSELFLGIKGKGVPPTPSIHAIETKGNCASCHMYRPADTEGQALSSGGHTFRAGWDSCSRCHGNGPSLTSSRKRQTTALMRRVEAALADSSTRNVSKSALEAAQWNYQMVLKDGGYGVHNPTYAALLLRQSLRYLGVEP
ncbi:hypothetical protein FJZ36_09885 [Candidatus Poribacteria bacterium]|nr:hypothetical protein [Candidatus Poribacteria bacterium]